MNHKASDSIERAKQVRQILFGCGVPEICKTFILTQITAF